MRAQSLPARPRALLFDLDSTLYEHPEYASFQNEVLITRLAEERRESREVTASLISAMRDERKASGAGSTSLGNLFLSLGISIETSVRWREELIKPYEWLRPDPRLDEALALLAENFTLALVTNNPRSVGTASLAALGVARHFALVVGLDDTGRSKPDPAPYATAIRLLGREAPEAVSIGDRWDVDIAPALGLGMGGILIEGIEELYRLPSLLLPGKTA